MGRTYTVMSPDGQEVVLVTFSEPVWHERITVRFISDLKRDELPREVYQVIRELMDSNLLRKIEWDPEGGLKMVLRRRQRGNWLINRLPGILSDIAIPSRQAQSVDR